MALSPKKDKLVEEAQKFILRGQFDKAAKAYEQILALDPAAVNHRQKLAELLIKCGRSDDARKEFETIGKHFAKNGFFLKAIAVYKQLQKLFPDDISISLMVAELNEKHGLIANSLSEYKLIYEFYEKGGKKEEALGILERMQNVDAQNITIKIKLAEAFISYGKRDESYSVFAKIISILLERSDDNTLGKISTRVIQLFPDKPDFMLDILSEQLAQGNASAVIPSLQNLLRSNPKNKRVWEMTIKAYRQIDQPKRVKVACQHYLKFFPSEPSAMIGLIMSTADEQDVSESLKLLEQYETALFSADFLTQLEQVYKTLEKIEPINARIIEGLVRIAKAVGNESAVISLSDKLKSLQTISGVKPSVVIERPVSLSYEPLNLQDSELLEITETIEEVIPENSQTSIFDEIGFETAVETFGAASYTGGEDVSHGSDEDIEIDVEIDEFDSPFGSFDEAVDTSSGHDNWLDSVSNLFDTISTEAHGVKFGDEMDSTDAQSHFDLGQAFKEMGLFDEAINEFRKASDDAARRIECMIMQCVCLRERGEVETAVTMLQALMKSELSSEEISAVKYELATAYESIGKHDEAKTLLNEIDRISPGFRDISSRLDAVTLTESLDFSDDDLKDF
ncbi:MAG: tetratricopeptide repeat protein [Desulfuromonadaceae bacterium]|nr:tetratricopeptide repeat protein [Desulfuromonadaceae bacterium]MDD2854308.1 tetratricopeptide repeat protein [Desulfuromonadaceae bacterium]